MQGDQGVVAHVKLPPRHELDAYDKLELDFTLGCPGEPSPLPSCRSLIAVQSVTGHCSCQKAGGVQAVDYARL